VSWDGKSESGSLAAEGSYTAKLTVNYRKGSATATSTVESSSFILDITPPTGSVSFTPQQFSPDAQGMMQPVTVNIKGSSKVAQLDSWSLEIMDPSGKVFRSFDGKWPSERIQWDGKSSDGETVAPGASYNATATLRDEFGLTGQATGGISVAGVPTTPTTTVGQAPGTFGVTPETTGFSPPGTIKVEKLDVGYGKSDAVESWKLEIVDSNGTTVKIFSGDASNMSATLSWDGTNDSGSMSPEGAYTARLSVDYGGLYAANTAMSDQFVLDLTPPTGSIMLSEPLFSPIEGSPTVTLTIDASSRTAKIASWRMEIYDPDNHLFKAFEAAWSTKDAVWNGKGIKGDLVQSAEDYPVLAKVRDEYGNVGQLKSVVPVDILVEKTSTGFRILASRIFFKPYTADYVDVRPDLAAQNMKRLDDMAAKLKKFPNYNLKLVGHAVSIYWDNKSLGEIEQKDVLIPLSEARAEAVLKALIDRGLESPRFTTEGVGASDQLVPDSDLADRWQNRRVAFFIER
jgi:outer membrane protein OmpA-like peptidoglycan-associated protein/flagellar hook assembly protein FlgD